MHHRQHAVPPTHLSPDGYKGQTSGEHIERHVVAIALDAEERGQAIQCA
jgi:hypothetical protein